MQNKEFKLTEIATLTKSRLFGNPEHIVHNVADLESALSTDASFLANPRYEQAMRSSKAGVVFVDPKTLLEKEKNYLVNENPSRAFQQLVEIFYEGSVDLTGFEGIHPTAIIHPTAKIGENVVIGPYAVIDKNVTIGNNTFIATGCYIGPRTIIGDNCLLHPHVIIRENCLLENKVTIQPGAIIGSCGFGYTTDKQGHHTKLNQVGNVTIENDVEIGANTTIDRSRFKTTRIGQGTKIDNLVQIAHGAQIGKDNLIVAQTGIAGSAETGKHVILAGQTALAGHIKIADGVILSGRTGATKSITEPGKYGGVPAMPLSAYNRNSVLLRNIEGYIKEIKDLKERISKLEDQQK